PLGAVAPCVGAARMARYGANRLVYMSGGSTMWESADISLYSAIKNLLVYGAERLRPMRRNAPLTRDFGTVGPGWKLVKQPADLLPREPQPAGADRPGAPNPPPFNTGEITEAASFGPRETSVFGSVPPQYP